MDEETNKIRQHIDMEREQLGRNFDEIADRVKSASDRVKNATDVKGYFDRNTGLILGAAVAGGFLLSLAFRGSRTADYTAEREYESGPKSARPAEPKAVSKHLQHVSDTLDGIVGGLVAVAAAKLESFVADAVPGFREQYDAMDRQGVRSSVHQVKHDASPSTNFSAAR